MVQRPNSQSILCILVHGNHRAQAETDTCLTASFPRYLG